MHRRTRRGNRQGLTLVGLTLMIAGAALFAAHQGWFGSRAAATTVYPANVRRFVHANGAWLWTLLAVVAIVAGLVFLRWLLVQPRVDRLGRLRVDTEDDALPDAGRTRLPAAALCSAVEDDILALRGVRRAAATMTGHPDAPELWLRVSAETDADVARIRRSVVGDVLADARRCLDLPTMPTYVELVVAGRDTVRTSR